MRKRGVRIGIRPGRKLRRRAHAAAALMMAASMVSADSHRYLLEPIPQERQMLTTGACAVSAAGNAFACVEPASSANNAHRCGVAFGAERSGAKTAQPPSRTEPHLQIVQDIFGDEAVYRLV